MKDLSPDKNPNQYFCTDHLNSDLKGRSVRGGAVTLAAQGFKFSLQIISNVVLARLLTPADYGLIGMATAVIGLLELFKDMGLSKATIQKAEINHQQVSTLFWVNVLASMVLMLIIAMLAPVIAWFYNEPRLIGITLAIACAFIFDGLTIQHQALLNRQMQFTTLSTIDVGSLASGIAAGIFTAKCGGGYWSLVVVQVVSTITNMIAVWWFCSWRPGFPTKHSDVRSMLAFGRNLTGFNLINYFARNLDNVLIGKYWGAQQLGLYAKAYQLFLFPLQQINSPFAAVAVPALSRLADSPERYKQAYLRILEKLVMITTPLVVFMIVASDWLVTLLLGPQWHEASQIFALLGVVALTQPVANTAGWLFITQGRTHHMLQSGMVGGMLAIVAIALGLPWGAKGVAASYAISGLLIRTPLLFWFVGRSGAVRAGDLYYTIAPFAGAAVASITAVFGFRSWTFIANPFVGIIASASIILGTTSLVLVVLPTGRRAVRDLVSLTASLKKQKEFK